MTLVCVSLVYTHLEALMLVIAVQFSIWKVTVFYHIFTRNWCLNIYWYQSVVLIASILTVVVMSGNFFPCYTICLYTRGLLTVYCPLDFKIKTCTWQFSCTRFFLKNYKHVLVSLQEVTIVYMWTRETWLIKLRTFKTVDWPLPF